MATIVTVGADRGTTAFPTDAGGVTTGLNRSQSGSFTAYASCAAGDVLVVEHGFHHVLPTGGGAGAGSYYNTSASDLPESDTAGTTDNAYNPWIEFRAPDTPASTGPSLGGPGEGDTGTQGTYLPADAVIEHGDLSGKGGTMHDAAQIELTDSGGLYTGTEVETALTEVVRKALIDAKGDLLVGTAADALARLAVGTDGQVLTADSAQSTGLKWETPSGGGGGGGGAFAADVGDGSNTTIGVEHDLGTEDVLVEIRVNSSGLILPADHTDYPTSITVDDDDNITLVWGSAPSTDEYRVVVSAGGSAAAAAETWDEVMSDISTGLVHRWEFDESSGYPQDSIGSLHMTTGTVDARQQAGPIGATSAMELGGGLNGSGNGSAPTGANPRTIIAVVRTTSALDTHRDKIVHWGPTGSTRQWCHACFNHDGFAQAGFLFWSDDHKPGHWLTDGGWHLVAFRYRARGVSIWADGCDVYAGTTGAALNTGTSGNLSIGADDMLYDDLSIWSRWVSNRELERLWESIKADV